MHVQYALSGVSCGPLLVSEYGKKDALIDYALRVIRNGLVVRRAEIPRDKSTCSHCDPTLSTISRSH
jgi:hypothetical protein